MNKITSLLLLFGYISCTHAMEKENDNQPQPQASAPTHYHFSPHIRVLRSPIFLQRCRTYQADLEKQNPPKKLKKVIR